MSVRSILTFLLVFCGLVAVVVPVSMAHFHWSASGATADQRRGAVDSPAALPQFPASAVSCTGTSKSTASHAAMQDIADHAQVLSQQGRVDEALSRYDDLLQLDPGFPGLYLDRATALIAARRYDDALREVAQQISVSACLERLSPSAIDAYCQRELPQHSPALCRTAMKTLQRTAHFQAAIAQMQLGKSSAESIAANQTDPGMALAPLPTRQRAGTVAEHPPQRVAERPAHRAVSGPRQRTNEDVLASAEGTDAALGAYSH